jgi:hypothetical protein
MSIDIPETLNESPGAAETATAEMTRKTNTEWADIEDMQVIAESRG